MTEAAHLKIAAESDKYMEVDTPVGKVLLKLMMQKEVTNKRATATYLRDKLTNMDTYMSIVNSDIEKFNQYVKENVDVLKSRGERTDNLMINLFKAYQVASDKEFVRYIKTNRDNYNDGYNL